MADLKRLPKRNGPRFCTLVHDIYKGLKLNRVRYCPGKNDYVCALEIANEIIPNAVGQPYCGKIIKGGRPLHKPQKKKATPIF